MYNQLNTHSLVFACFLIDMCLLHRYERPILASREPTASDSVVQKATQLQKDLSTIVNEFILKRGNILNAQHLPPKLIQFVCCSLTPLQIQLYDELIAKKDYRYIRDSKHTNTLNSIRLLLLICSHPRMLIAAYDAKKKAGEPIDEELSALVELVQADARSKQGDSGVNNSEHMPAVSKKNTCFGNAFKSISHTAKSASSGYRSLRGGVSGNVVPTSGSEGPIDPYESGKFLVLYRLMLTMRVLTPTDRIVVVSNYTSTLDLLQQMCSQNNWPVCRLDGSTTSTKRTKLVDEFNNPFSNAFCFLLSSKAGGCGINLIGGNR